MFSLLGQNEIICKYKTCVNSNSFIRYPSRTSCKAKQTEKATQKPELRSQRILYLFVFKFIFG